MTKQDYIVLAQAINKANEELLNNREVMANIGVGQLAKVRETYFHHIAQVLMRDNERFNIETFAKACNVTLAPRS